MTYALYDCLLAIGFLIKLEKNHERKPVSMLLLYSCFKCWPFCVASYIPSIEMARDRAPRFSREADFSHYPPH